MNKAQRSEIFGSKTAFLCLFPRISALFVTAILVAGLAASAQEVETSVGTVTDDKGQQANFLAVSADTVEDVRQVAQELAQGSQGNVAYVFPDPVATGTPTTNFSTARTEEQIQEGRYAHLKGLAFTWAGSTFSAIVLSQTPMSSRYASVALTSVMSISRIFKDDWQGDGIDIITKGFAGGFKKIGAAKLIEYKIPTIMSQFAFALSMGMLQYNVQHFFMHHSLSFDWKLFVSAGITTFAAGTWEEIFRTWIRGRDSPFTQRVARNLRDLRRVGASIAGPQINSPEDGWVKYSAIASYSMVAIAGLKAFFTNPAVLRQQIRDGVARYRDRNKMCSLNLIH